MGENPIALRSKRRLTTALADLMHEKAYHDISITELCKRAGLSRPAFYQNFDRMDDVLARHIRDLISSSIGSADTVDLSTVKKLAEVYFHAFADNKEFFHIVVDNGMDLLLINESIEVFSRIESMPESLEHFNDTVKRHFPRFASAGIASVACSMLRDKDRVGEMEAHAAILQILEACLKG